MKNLLTIIFLFLNITVSLAQEARDWKEYLLDYGATENIEASTLESSYDYLYQLEEQPLNINTATREELEQLPFLTTRQTADIQEYIYRHGAIKTMGELSFITSLDYNQKYLLSVFTYPGEVKKARFPKLRDIARYGRHSILATGKIPFYTRKGDENGYEGYQYKHSIKYDFTYGDYVRLGILGSQDAGEPFFAGKNATGYDFYSFYLVLKKAGRLKTLALGRYRLKFGMGLVLNNNNSYGKQSALTTLQSTGSNIRAHASRTDANYMQGAAATLSVAKGLDISLFASRRKFDATLNDDGTIATILSSGYHRTKTELSKKNNATNTTAGGNVSFRKNGFHIGATAVYTALDRELSPDTKAVYRQHYASGKTFLNASVDYGYTGHLLTFSGETATGSCKDIATINMLTLNPGSRLSMTILQRYYAYGYYSLMSQSFSEGGMVQNESGACLGISWRPAQSLSITAYTDYAYFAWPKYQASAASHAFDNMLQATWTRGDWSLSARYRLKLREKDNSDKTALTYRTEQRARLSATYSGAQWQSRTQADFSSCAYNGSSTGWMLTQNVSCTAVEKLRLNASIAYFDTDDYNSRVYSYERGLLQTFSVPSYYGNGIRYTLLVSTELIKNLLLTAKIGTVNYFDRSSIGSGYQLISRSSATDLEMQARWKF